METTQQIKKTFALLNKFGLALSEENIIWVIDWMNIVPVSKFHSYIRTELNSRGLNIYKEAIEKVEAFMLDNSKLGAVKELKNASGLGLKEAKDLIDEASKYLIPKIEDEY